MKTRKKNQKRLKALRKIAKEKHHGLQSIKCGRRNFMEARFRVADHEDYLLRISSLLEVCVLALDGNGGFYSKILSHKSAGVSIGSVLEMAIELLPFDDIFKLERMMAILENDSEHRYFPEELKEFLKPKDHEERGEEKIEISHKE